MRFFSIEKNTHRQTHITRKRLKAIICKNTSYYFNGTMSIFMRHFKDLNDDENDESSQMGLQKIIDGYHDLEKLMNEEIHQEQDLEPDIIYTQKVSISSSSV